MAGIGDPLVDIITEKGWLDSQVLEKAQSDFSASSFEDVTLYLVDKKQITEEHRAEALAIQNGLSFVGEDFLIGSPEATELVSMEFARTRCVLALRIEEGCLHVAISDPTDLALVDDLSFMSGMTVECFVSSPSAIQKGVSNSYSGSEDDIGQLLDPDDVAINSTEEEDSDGDDAPVIALVNMVIAKAVRQGASDIHIESMEKNIRVRFRVDGKCSVVERPNKRLQGALFGRIKLMARMDIAEKRKPQDGPIKLKVDGRQIDLRVSSLPSAFGESIVMRILDKEAVMKGVDQLGFHPSDQEQFDELLDRPNGIVLVTGPTGSGKTTTLYAALNAKNKPNVKIITAEDPVEYNVSGINQVQVNHQIGLNFSRILRAMLRQAPNVILVGEIRDHETAEIAIEASLTGHLVFSTLHTNDAPASITRLIDMGIKPYLVSASVIAILAQRLIRVNCKGCAIEYEPSEEHLIAAGITEEMAEGKTFFRGRGCATCHQTGYKGRLGIYELMKLNGELRKAIFNNLPTHELREIALRGGMHTLLMDGVRKVFGGMTTVEEVLRVAKSNN